MPCGTGFAVVKLATDRATGEEYAVKIMALPEANAKAGDNENTRSDRIQHAGALLYICLYITACSRTPGRRKQLSLHALHWVSVCNEPVAVHRVHAIYNVACTALDVVHIMNLLLGITCVQY